MRRGLAWGIVVLAASIVVAAPASAEGRPGDPPDMVRLRVRTPHSGFNRLVVSVTVCTPGTDLCATIDDVMVDTGSTGLRLEASAIPAGLRLPAFRDPDGKPLAECLRFVHDDAWGPLAVADLRLGGLVAAGVPLQVVADESASRPVTCPPSAGAATSNGTLGIGPFLTDCPGSCDQDPARPGVFRQEAGSWVSVGGRVEPGLRLPNPVSLFPAHDNGVVFELPATPGGGVAEVAGTLTLGVGSSPDTRLGSAEILRLGPTGRFTTVYGGLAYPDSYIDSGTETNILADDTLPRCPGASWAYCVSPERRLEAVLVGQDGARIATAFTVGDYATLRNRRFGALDSLAVAADPASKAFVWGAPFFLGRQVFVLLEGRGVPGLAGLKGPAYGVGQAHQP